MVVLGVLEFEALAKGAFLERCTGEVRMGDESIDCNDSRRMFLPWGTTVEATSGSARLITPSGTRISLAKGEQYAVPEAPPQKDALYRIALRLYELLVPGSRDGLQLGGDVHEREPVVRIAPPNRIVHRWSGQRFSWNGTGAAPTIVRVRGAGHDWRVAIPKDSSIDLGDLGLGSARSAEVEVWVLGRPIDLEGDAKLLDMPARTAISYAGSPLVAAFGTTLLRSGPAKRRRTEAALNDASKDLTPLGRLATWAEAGFTERAEAIVDQQTDETDRRSLGIAIRRLPKVVGRW